MKSGLPQGLVLFNLFINYLQLGTSSKVVMFADDNALFPEMKSRMDCEELQKDIGKLVGPPNALQCKELDTHLGQEIIIAHIR